MVTFSQLEMLIAFADANTLSKAAETLHLSQPTLTRAMKQLEENGMDALSPDLELENDFEMDDVLDLSYDYPIF